MIFSFFGGRRAVARCVAGVCLTAALAASPVRAPAQISLLHYDSVVYAIESGNGPHPIVFLPGLGGGSYVYDAAIKHFAARETTYAIDFAGFGSEPPVPPPYLDRYEKSVVHLLVDRHVTGAILVGEHFGGQIALRVAADAPDRVAGVVTIDSLPSGPSTNALSSSLPDAGEYAAIAHYRAMPKAQFADVVGTLAKTLTADAARASTVAEHLAGGDPVTFGAVMYEYSKADVRPRLPSVSAPVDVFLSFTRAVPAATWVAIYTPFYAKLAHPTFRPIGPSQHLMMYDRPAAFDAALENAVSSFER